MKVILTAALFLIVSCVVNAQTPQSYLFVAEPQGIQGFSVNSVTGSLVSTGAVAPDANVPVAIATNNPASLLFAVNANATISVFQIAATGDLTEIANSPFNITDATQPGAIAVSVDGTVLYVALGIANSNSTAGTLDSFSISASGQLAEIGNAPAPSLAGPTPLPASIIVASTNLYLAAGGTVQSYSLNQDVPTAEATTNLPNGSVVAAMVGNTNFLFAAFNLPQAQTGFISSLTINPDGTLSIVSTADVESASNPIANEAFSNGFLYTNNGVFSVSSGVLSLIQPDILPPGPASPFAASSTAPFLFQGDQALNQGNPPLIFPFQIQTGGTLVNSEPPLALSGVPTSIIVATGTAIPPTLPAVVFEPASVNFNPIQVGQSLTAQITLYSTGSVPLETGNISLSGDSSFSITSNTCQAELAPGLTCFVYVAFTPLQPGNFTASLNLVGNVTASVLLSGDPPAPVPPTPVPAISVAPPTQSGNAGSSFVYQVAATNFGSTPTLTVTATIPGGGCIASGMTVTCSTTAPSSADGVRGVPWLLPIGLGALAILCAPRRRRRAILCTAALVALTACGSPSSKSIVAAPPPTPTVNTTPKGQYSIGLVATSGTTKAVSSAVLIVN